MVGLVKKKLGKIVGLKKEDFNELIKLKEIAVVKPRLIPTYKVGDEMSLTSVLLSSLRLVKEFRHSFFTNSKIMKGGKAYFYTEVSFSDYKDARLDGLILIVKSGIIKDAAILEIKNGKDKLDKVQLERYQQIARTLAIPTFITVSNEFVTEPTQSPVALKSYKTLDMFHLSWTYLLTIAHVLLYKNNTNIEDEDQVEIMKEVVLYLESEKSGVLGHNRMGFEWTQVVDKINKGGKLKQSDKEVSQAVRSWQQQERDMALGLSRTIGFVVDCGEQKYKGKLQERISDDCKELAMNSYLNSVFKVKGAASDIGVALLFEKRTMELEVRLKVPTDKTQKGQIGWLKRQVETCIKRQPSLVERISSSVFIEPCIKGVRNNDRFNLKNFEGLYDYFPGKELREFKIIFVKDFGAKFSSQTKFVELSESMLCDFYNAIVQYLIKWEPSAPKVAAKEIVKEEEAFIDEVNRGEFEVLPKIEVNEEVEKQNFFRDSNSNF